jgi:hypothetical protein
MPHQISGEMRECIQICADCHAFCTETTIHCLGMGGELARTTSASWSIAPRTAR